MAASRTGSRGKIAICERVRWRRRATPSPMPTSAEIYATTDEPLPEADVQLLASHLSEALGPERFLEADAIRLIRAEQPESEGLPEDLPRAGSTLQVRLCTAYYGKGYERGYWPEIAATLEFLRRRMPSPSRVWYGPDGGDPLREVSEALLDEHWAHWALVGGRPYYRKSGQEKI